VWEYTTIDTHTRPEGRSTVREYIQLTQVQDLKAGRPLKGVHDNWHTKAGRQCAGVHCHVFYYMIKYFCHEGRHCDVKSSGFYRSDSDNQGTGQAAPHDVSVLQNRVDQLSAILGRQQAVITDLNVSKPAMV